MTEDDSDDAVGYRRPPKKTRFKKGQSGNPKGRPKKVPADEVEILDNVLATRVNVSGGQHKSKKELAKIVVQGLVREAAGGDLESALFIVRHYRPQEIFPEGITIVVSGGLPPRDDPDSI